ncbi:MAG: thioesterase family protein [Hyphomonadaceae bacterium]
MSENLPVESQLPATLFRGAVNTWECDEMGHMNVRFYVERATQGLALLAAELGLAGCFRADASTTIVPLDQHIRFLREGHAGAPMEMAGGVVELGETDAIIYQELTHAGGGPSATFRTKILHADAKTLAPKPWPGAVRQGARALHCAIPAHGAARSIDLERAPSIANVERANMLGAPLIGRGAYMANHCDAFGRARVEMIMGRISDAVPNMLQRWRIHAGGEGQRAGGAVVEYRLLYRRWPRAGDLIEMRSGITEVTEKTHALAHWLLDPVSGEAWATAEAVGVSFDLDTRKIIVPPQSHRDALAAQRVESFAI